MNLSQLQGLWRRDWLRADGYEDSTTRVYWAQAGNLFVDVRVPKDLPDLSAYECLADLNALTLVELLRAEGFAGNVSMHKDVCTWHREINWHGQTDSIDAGKLWFSDTPDVLIEDGIYASYSEQWCRIPDEVFNVKRVKSGKLSGILISSNSRFFLGIGDSIKSKLADIKELLSRGIITAECRHVFSSEYCSGHWQGNQGIAELSTQPFQTGNAVMEKRSESVIWLHRTFDGLVKPCTLVEFAP